MCEKEKTKAKNDYERIIMNDKLINNNKNHYDKILDDINKEILTKSFGENLKKVQKIDNNHYKEKIEVDDLKKYLNQYKDDESMNDYDGKIMILQNGNPEIIFQVCLEILKSKITEAKIVIQDFCLGQNTLIVDTINEIIKQNKINKKINLENLLTDNELIEKSKKFNKIICIGDSNLYNRLESEISNLELNTYGIFEVYSDSEEFEELEKTFFEYCYQKEFEAENYSDLNVEDTIRLINKNGYKFATVLFSKDEKKQKEFKEKIKSKYVIINKNPFKEIKFKL